jgi:transposase-like protein/IS1 family transposase
MNCPKCSETAKKHGKTRDGQQRYRCKACSLTFSEPKPLPGLSTDLKTAAMALKMLLEGMSIRATARLTGLDKDTVQRLVERAGQQCYQFLADTMQGLTVGDVQVDEVWSFVGMKEKTAFFQGGHEDLGDCYTYTAIDRHTKLLITFHCGQRTGDHAQEFSHKLAGCIAGDCRPHVSTDGFPSYHTSIPDAFGYRVDHGMLIKQFGSPSTSERRRYSPAKIIGTKHYQNLGHSEDGQICTSHVERHNLTIRMQNRRFTRLTNAFSKKWENHEAMFALFAAWYNFCRRHQTLDTTPAVAAGLTGEPWTMERLLQESANSLAA